MVTAIDAAGLRRARAALLAGRAIVAPCSSPLPYGVFALTRQTVNVAKGRAADQPCGVFVHSLEMIREGVALDRDVFALARYLNEAEQLSLLVPLTSSAPAWMREEAVDGEFGVTTQYLPTLRPLFEHFGHLSSSSANRTGEAVAVSAGGAEEMFDGRLLVLDGEPWRPADGVEGSATIVRVARDGRVEIVRDGVNNGHGSEPARSYISGLYGRWARQRAHRRGA